MPTKDVTAKLPEAIAAYVKASNAADMGAYLATFVDDPLINDIRRLKKFVQWPFNPPPKP